MLPNEKIQDEQEFNYSCANYGQEAKKILLFIASQQKERAFAPDCQSKERDALAWKVKNIDEFINLIDNAAQPTAPEFKL